MISIRDMKIEDKDEIMEMMKVFYDSPAIFIKSPEEVLSRDIDDCIGDMPYVEGFVFALDDVPDGSEEKLAGYAITAKSYSTEFARIVVWIEDLYLRPEYRNKRIGTDFFTFLDRKYAGQPVRFKLEVEKDNTAAFDTYKYCGFDELPYIVMSKEN